MGRRFLVIKLRHHGDVLLTSPVINALKAQDAACEVDVLVYHETRDMVAANPDVAVLHTIDRQWKKLGVRQQFKHEWALLQAIRERQYDVVVCLADQWRAALLTRASRAPTRIGIAYPYRDNKIWQHCFTDLVPELTSDSHIVAQNLSALRPLGFIPMPNTPLRMAYGGQDLERVQSLLCGQGWQGEAYAVVHPGSRWFFKCWDDDKTAATVAHLLNLNVTVVLSAAPDERELKMLQQIQSLLPIRFTGRLMVMAGNMNLRELAALIDGADLFVGVDSVPMHMAAACATPCVALFGPTWVTRWRPWSEQATVVYAGDFAALPHPDSIDVNTKQRYLTAIPVDAVWQAIETYLPLGEAS